MSSASKQPKLKDIQTAIMAFEKNDRKNSGAPKIYTYGSVDEAKGLKVIPFDLGDLDDATGIGGIPRGRIIEVFGPESSGKSWLSYKLIASAQRQGLVCALLDIEHAMDPEWVSGTGVDLQRLVYGHNFSCGEEALAYLCDMIKKKLVDFVVLDSTAALVPRVEIEANEFTQQVGLQARMMSQAVRKISDACGQTGGTALFVNQIREKVGVFFGNPETTPGGRALKFYASMRIEVKRTTAIQDPSSSGDKKLTIGFNGKMKVVKSKVAPPMLDGEFEIYFNPDSQSPLVQMCKHAYEVKILTRKRDEVSGKMLYVFRRGKDIVRTDCDNFVDMAKWLEESNPDMIREIADAIESKGAAGGQVNMELVSQVRLEYSKEPVAAGEEVPPAAEEGAAEEE